MASGRCECAGFKSECRVSVGVLETEMMVMNVLGFAMNTCAERWRLPRSETLEAERALMEEKMEDKINNLQKHLRHFYSQELEVRSQCSA